MGCCVQYIRSMHNAHMHARPEAAVNHTQRAATRPFEHSLPTHSLPSHTASMLGPALFKQMLQHTVACWCTDAPPKARGGECDSSWRLCACLWIRSL